MLVCTLNDFLFFSFKVIFMFALVLRQKYEQSYPTFILVECLCPSGHFRHTPSSLYASVLSICTSQNIVCTLLYVLSVIEYRYNTRAP